MWYLQLETGMPKLLRMRKRWPLSIIRTAWANSYGYRRSYPNHLGLAARQNERHAQKKAQLEVEFEVERDEPGQGFETGQEEVTDE